MSKYRPLEDYLDKLVVKRIRLSINEIETILDLKLPASSKKYREWWANNQSGHSHAVWLNVGWKVQSLELGEYVNFEKE